MAIDDASTALAPAASLTDPPVSTGAKRFPRALAAGFAHCVEDAGGGRSRHHPVRASGPLPAVMAGAAPGAAACRARPFGPPDASPHP